MPAATIQLRSRDDSDDDKRRKSRKNVRLLVILIGMLGLAFWSAEEKSATAVLPLVPSETRHDFGDRPVGMTATTQITLQNPSAGPFDLAGAATTPPAGVPRMGPCAPSGMIHDCGSSPLITSETVIAFGGFNACCRQERSR
jgi:hypothetical protein